MNHFSAAGFRSINALYLRRTEAFSGNERHIRHKSLCLIEFERITAQKNTFGPNADLARHPDQCLYHPAGSEQSRQSEQLAPHLFQGSMWLNPL